MSVFSTRPYPRLPDQIRVEFGPPDLLARSFLALDRAVRERGIYLSVSHDLRELAAINRLNLKEWYPLPPMFDHALGGITDETGFWLRGVNEEGEVVLTQAGRLYPLSGTTLTDEIESMRLFYPDPQSQKPAGEEWFVETESARTISGRVCYTGALWFRPDYRGRGLASIMPRLTRAYATTRWYPDYTLSLVKTSLVMRGLARTYGWRNVDSRIRWVGSREGGAELEFALGWMNQEDVLDDLDQFRLLLSADADSPSLI